MARLKDEHRLSVAVDGEEVILTLKNPTNEELNKFLGKRWGAKDLVEANNIRCEFFDELLMSVENLEDANGCMITLNDSEKIPADWKNHGIAALFEVPKVEVKN